jgi:hypothetical protein
MKSLLSRIGRSGRIMIGLGAIVALVLVAGLVWLNTVERSEAACNLPGVGIYDIVPDVGASVSDATPCDGETITFSGTWKYTGAQTGGGNLVWSMGDTVDTSTLPPGTYVNTGSYYETDSYGNTCGYEEDVRFTVCDCSCDQPTGNRREIRSAPGSGGCAGDDWEIDPITDCCGNTIELKCISGIMRLLYNGNIVGSCTWKRSRPNRYYWKSKNECKIMVVHWSILEGSDCDGDGKRDYKRQGWNCRDGYYSRCYDDATERPCQCLADCTAAEILNWCCDGVLCGDAHCPGNATDPSCVP